jgi:hypothetical protein
MLNARSVPFELAEEERPDQQLQLAVLHESANPLLNVSPLGEAQPIGPVDQQMKDAGRLATHGTMRIAERAS